MRMNCAPSWFYLQDYKKMHGQGTYNLSKYNQYWYI